MVNSNQLKIQAKSIRFNTEHFSSLAVNPRFMNVTGQVSIFLDDLCFMPGVPDEEETLDYTLGLKAVMGDNFNPSNIGVFDAANKRLYACAFAKTSKEDSSDLAIIFGDLYNKESPCNVAKLTVDDDGNIGIIGVKAKISLHFQTEKRLDKNNKAYDKDVPYISVLNNTVIENGQRYGVAYLVPIRFEKDVEPTKEFLSNAWINGDLEALKKIIGVPFKGGGGWVPLMSIADSYRMCGLELPTMDIQFIDWEDVGLNTFNKHEMDLILHPDFHFPVIIGKPSKKTGKHFISRDVSKIRIQQTGDPSCLYNVLNGLKSKLSKKPQVWKHYQEQGFILSIRGFSSKNKEWTPDHSFAIGKVVDRVLTPKFDELLGLTESTEPVANIGDGSIDVVATTVVDTKALIANVDPTDKDVF